MSDGSVFSMPFKEHDLAGLGLDHWQSEFMKRSPTGLEEGWDELKITVATMLWTMMEGMLVSRSRFEMAESLINDKLQSQEIPFSHFPEIGSITLQQLLAGGIRSACLVPLGAGVCAGTNSLIAGQVLAGFQAVLAGGGMTICAISALWVADKILKGIKDLRDDDFEA